MSGKTRGNILSLFYSLNKFEFSQEHILLEKPMSHMNVALF